MKRGQEEVTGFMLVVIIVVIIAVVVLGITLRNDRGSLSSSSEITQFLESALHTTTSCSAQPPAYLSVADTMIACRATPTQLCSSRESVCEILNQTLPKIIGASWKIGNSQVLQGYKIDVIYRPRTARAPETIIQSIRGNCSHDQISGEYLLPDTHGGGTIITALTLCS